MACYVYGVLAASADVPALTGVGGCPVFAIASEEVAALASEVEEAEPRMGREEITAHARVLEQAQASSTVLPMRFGVVMEDEAEVRSRLLERHRDELASQLRELAGTSELRLRAVYEEEALLRAVVADEPEVARLRSALRHVPADAGYYDRIRLGELVAAAVQRRRERDAAEILDTLQPLALAVDSGEPAHEREVVSASFLVENERIGEFDAAVDRLGRAQAGRMRFKYTGPLPPHSFVKLAAEV